MLAWERPLLVLLMVCLGSMLDDSAHHASDDVRFLRQHSQALNLYLLPSIYPTHSLAPDRFMYKPLLQILGGSDADMGASHIRREQSTDKCKSMAARHRL